MLELVQGHGKTVENIREVWDSALVSAVRFQVFLGIVSNFLHILSRSVMYSF